MPARVGVGGRLLARQHLGARNGPRRAWERRISVVGVAWRLDMWGLGADRRFDAAALPQRRRESRGRWISPHYSVAVKSSAGANPELAPAGSSRTDDATRLKHSTVAALGGSGPHGRRQAN